MKYRCARRPDYRDRGITVCERWRDSYANFIADMGPRPTPLHSIDRINNSGHYEPANCRWATRTQQNNNRRCLAHEKPFTWNGLTMNISQWAAHLGVKLSVFSSRRSHLGWSVERTITTPVIHRKHRHSA
jgi:hypothetical protein